MWCTGEDWNAVMYDGITAYGDNWVISMVYFCLLFLLGNFVLLNVFLAIAVKSLDDARALKEQRNLHKHKWSLLSDNEDEIAGNRGGFANPTLPSAPPVGPELEDDMETLETLPEPEPEPPTPINPFTSLFLFSQENTFRQKCHAIAFNERFDNLILAAIIVSSILLALEDPVDKDAKINEQLLLADFFFTGLFTLEMLLKIVAMGLVLHRGAYLRDPWNILDFVVVVGSILNLALSVISQGNY